MNTTLSNNDWRTVPERRPQASLYRGGRPHYGRPRPSLYAPLPPVEVTPPKKTEANFPHLVAKAPKKASPEFASSFSTQVREMAAEEERQRLRTEYSRNEESKAHSEFQNVYLLGSVRTGTLRDTVKEFVRDLQEEFDAADMPFEREDYGAVAPPPTEADDGWACVKQKTRKPKREMTVSDLAAKYRAAGDDADRDEDEYNGDLFGTSHRHDHH